MPSIKIEVLRFILIYGPELKHQTAREKYINAPHTKREKKWNEEFIK